MIGDRFLCLALLVTVFFFFLPEVLIAVECTLCSLILEMIRVVFMWDKKILATLSFICI